MALSAVMSSVIEVSWWKGCWFWIRLLIVREGAQDEEDKEKTCQEILGLLQSCVSDPHPRVRYAVIYTIGQMALAFEVSSMIANKPLACPLKHENVDLAGRGLSGFGGRYESSRVVHRV